MIDYDKYQFHIKVIGSKEEFIKHIEDLNESLIANGAMNLFLGYVS